LIANETYQNKKKEKQTNKVYEKTVFILTEAVTALGSSVLAGAAKLLPHSETSQEMSCIIWKN